MLHFVLHVGFSHASTAFVLLMKPDNSLFRRPEALLRWLQHTKLSKKKAVIFFSQHIINNQIKLLDEKNHCTILNHTYLLQQLYFKAPGRNLVEIYQQFTTKFEFSQL